MLFNAQRLWPVKLAFFALVMADALGTAFLPVYARGLERFVSGVGTSIAAGAPVAFFWLAVAAAQISVARWLPGREQRHLLCAALALSALALLGAALAPWVELLVLCRAVGGFGYGMVMILAQDTLLRAYPSSARTQASALYLSLFFGGTVAGVALGGMIAAGVGFSATLALAAGITTAALPLAMVSPRYREPEGTLGSLAPLFRNRAFWGLVLLAALPSRLLIGAFLYFLLPLYLHDQGIPPETAGGVLMLYGLLLAFLATPLGRLIDRRDAAFSFTLLGLIGSGVALALVPLTEGGVMAVAAAVALLGLAQAAGMAPQVTLLFRATEVEMAQAGRARLLGLFRVGERLGLFLGPLLAGLLLPLVGYAGSFYALTCFILLAAGAFTLVQGAVRQPIVDTEA